MTSNIFINNYKINHYMALTILCAIFITFSSTQALAQDGGSALFGSLTNFLNALQTLLTGTWARIVAIIAVVILGFGWMAGRISWPVAGSIIGGIILVFGATAIVDSISGSI